MRKVIWPCFVLCGFVWLERRAFRGDTRGGRQRLRHAKEARAGGGGNRRRSRGRKISLSGRRAGDTYARARARARLHDADD